MSVVARERSEAHENVGRLDPTWGRLPIGGPLTPILAEGSICDTRPERTRPVACPRFL
jgi:hypothetical protein